ncbi:MAG TPA: GDSL-type esterase/lipase family protein [Candidatus Acidoferrum sp.]|nr:GDSL-type esterase/lipase family protein [Candidatus Acidoferrum sp.]
MKRGLRRLALAAAAALALVALPASAAAGDEHDNHYLALGDSYAFAFNPLVIAAGGGSNPANFVGYSDRVAATLDLSLTNASCPGETTGSMISGMRPDNGCQNYRALFPLHVQYSGAQLAFAVKYLQTHRHTDLVTLQIGGNDVLVLLRSCNGDTTCVLGGLGPVLAKMQANLDTIYSALRERGHYRGTVVAVPYFAFNYHDPANVAITSALDTAEAAAAARHEARVADVFGAFAAASAGSTPLPGVPCFAGLQVVLNPGPPPQCDIHPSAAGHAVMAQAVLAVVPSDED